MNDPAPDQDIASVWSTLRRRKVVQWGVAYAAGAWLLMQLLEYFSGTFDWPRQIQQLSTLALLIGLPIVLVLAWYHGDRGQQRITTPEFAILTLLLLLGGGAFWYYQRTNEAEKAAAPTASAVQPDASPGIKDARPSVAVLPFENRSREADDAYFVDGIHDDILTQLSKVSALRVISRTSVEQFRDTKLSMQAIGDQLGVTKILEGGVQRAGERVRVTVQLIDAATDAHLWAENYDRELSAVNIFAIQSEVATAIAGALKTALTPAEQERANVAPTRNLEAWEAYQIGKQRMANRTGAGLTAAEKQFRKAVALDPEFALAWVGLADTLSLQTFYAGRPKEAALSEAEQAVAQALELNSNLAEGWASAGLIADQRMQLERGEQMLRRAIALNPNYALAHHWLAGLLEELGRQDEALETLQQAVALDPLSTIINNQLGLAKVNVGRFEDAIDAFKHLIEIDPAMPFSYYNIGDVKAYGIGRLDEAPPWYEKAAHLDRDIPDAPASLAEVYWELGDNAEAERWLKRSLTISNRTAYASFVAAILYLDRGDTESARKYAQMASDLDRGLMVLIRNDDIRRRDYAGARSRYEKAFPELFSRQLTFIARDASAAVDLALVLQHTGERQRAEMLLDRSEASLRTRPRMGPAMFGIGYGILDVAIHSLRGEKALALANLREAEQAGWRQWWRYYRDFDPNLDSIRDEPEFKAVFADIERDMAKQRAALAKRPKDAPLDLAATGT